MVLETETGEHAEYRIVGADETNAAKGFISIDSPLARALLGRSVGDEIEAELPDSKQEFAVLEIRYE